MKLDTLIYHDSKWSLTSGNVSNSLNVSVVFIFGDSQSLKSSSLIHQLKQLYPQAHIVGASTSGNIIGAEITVCPAVATAVEFEKSQVKLATVDFRPGDKVEQLTHDLIEQLPKDQLRHVFILSDGLNVNGSDLVRGLNCLDSHVTISGGLAGDGDRFEETWVVADEPARQYRIVAVGFYGDDLVISCGCCSGWSSFGANREITKAEGNVLFELDNKPALDLYKEYLGEFAQDLPHSGMRFPLNIREDEDSPEVIRTLLAIDEDTKSITFAGDTPVGYSARLMKPNIDALIDGAKEAATEINNANNDVALGLVVSCVGRRVAMQQLVEEELEAVASVLGDNVQLTGFYSYGEIAPVNNRQGFCELHNQTMTLTAMYEN